MLDSALVEFSHHPALQSLGFVDGSFLVFFAWNCAICFLNPAEELVWFAKLFRAHTHFHNFMSDSDALM